MPPTQRGQAYKLGPGKWGLRYYDQAGARRRRSAPSRARAPRSVHYREVIEPSSAASRAPAPDLTLAEFVPTSTWSATPPRFGRGRSRPCASGSRTPTRAFGDVPLRDLERMRGEIATWQAEAPRALPLRDRAGASPNARSRRSLGLHRPRTRRSWPGRTVSPRRAPVRAFTRAEIEAIAAELSPALPAAAGVRRRDRAAARGVAGARAPRRRPLRRRAQRPPYRLQRRGGRARQDRRQPPTGAAHHAAPSKRSTRSRRGSTRRSCSRLAARRACSNLDNFRRREWAPAVEASGGRSPGADLRPALDVRLRRARRRRLGVRRWRGSWARASRMIERHYGDAARRGAGGDRRPPRRAGSRA